MATVGRKHNGVGTWFRIIKRDQLATVTRSVRARHGDVTSVITRNNATTPRIVGGIHGKQVGNGCRVTYITRSMLRSAVMEKMVGSVVQADVGRRSRRANMVQTRHRQNAGIANINKMPHGRRRQVHEMTECHEQTVVLWKNTGNERHGSRQHREVLFVAPNETYYVTVLP